jgi:hypothetical protein
MTFKFEILILKNRMKMDINNFEFIYFSIMDEFDPFIYSFNPNCVFPKTPKLGVP